MNDNQLLVAVVGGICSFAVALGGAITVGQYLWETNISCPAFGVSVERPVRYNFWAGGCFVQDTNGQWVLTGNYWNNTERK